MNKIKLCMVIPSLQAGGMERVMSELAGFFCQKNDLEVHMILYGKTPEIFYDVPDNLTIHHPKTFFNNTLRHIYSIGRLFYLREEVKRINPDSILSFGEYWNSFVLLALLGLSYPVFISDRCSPEMKYSSFHSFLRRILYPRSEGIVTQTEKAKEIYLSNNKHPNVEVIANPIRNFDASKLPTEREKNILMVGRLIRTKHQDKLIEMFAKVILPEWKLVIVGYDHLKQNNMERLKELAKDLNIEQRVVFMGKQKNIDEIYTRSSIFAFTSSSEGFPNVLGEAMAAELPVIAFDCVAGPSDLIRNNINGVLIPLFDYNLFEEKLKVLMSNVKLREQFGTNARESIKDLSVERIGEQFYNFMFCYK